MPILTRAARAIANAADTAQDTTKLIRRRKPTQPLFKEGASSEVEASRLDPITGTNTRFADEVDRGMLGEVTVGRQSSAPLGGMGVLEAGNTPARRALAKRQSDLGIEISAAKRAGMELPADAIKELEAIDARFAADATRAGNRAAQTVSNAKAMERGISLPGEGGIIYRSGATKAEAELDGYKVSDFVVGDSRNGVTYDGVVYGNVTDNQMKLFNQNKAARDDLAASMYRYITNKDVELVGEIRKIKTQSDVKRIQRRINNMKDGLSKKAMQQMLDDFVAGNRIKGDSKASSEYWKQTRDTQTFLGRTAKGIMERASRDTWNNLE